MPQYTTSFDVMWPLHWAFEADNDEQAVQKTLDRLKQLQKQRAEVDGEWTAKGVVFPADAFYSGVCNAVIKSNGKPVDGSAWNAIRKRISAHCNKE